MADTIEKKETPVEHALKVVISARSREFLPLILKEGYNFSSAHERFREILRAVWARAQDDTLNPRIVSSVIDAMIAVHFCDFGQILNALKEHESTLNFSRWQFWASDFGLGCMLGLLTGVNWMDQNDYTQDSWEEGISDVLTGYFGVLAYCPITIPEDNRTIGELNNQLSLYLKAEKRPVKIRRQRYKLLIKNCVSMHYPQAELRGTMRRIAMMISHSLWGYINFPKQLSILDEVYKKEFTD